MISIPFISDHAIRGARTAASLTSGRRSSRRASYAGTDRGALMFPSSSHASARRHGEKRRVPRSPSSTIPDCSSEPLSASV